MGLLPGGGRVLHHGVRQGCAPVLGSFWPENSGIRIYFCWRISVIGVNFHLEFLGLGFTVILKILVMGWIIFRATHGQFQINRFQVILVLKNVLRSEPRSNGHWRPKFSFPALNPLSLDVKLFLLLLQNSGMGYQYLTYIVDLDINIRRNFWDWVVTEILAAHMNSK